MQETLWAGKRVRMKNQSTSKGIIGRAGNTRDICQGLKREEICEKCKDQTDFGVFFADGFENERKYKCDKFDGARKLKANSRIVGAGAGFARIVVDIVIVVLCRTSESCQRNCRSQEMFRSEVLENCTSMSQIKVKARGLGITPGKMKKTELIHSIQLAEGCTPCYDTSVVNCPYTDCCFRTDCLGISS